MSRLISIKDGLYGNLKAMKGNTKSFSEVIEGIINESKEKDYKIIELEKDLKMLRKRSQIYGEKS